MSSSITHRQNREHPHLGKKKKKGIGDGRTDCDKHVQCLARKMNTFMCEQHSILSLIPFLSFINPSPLIPFPHFCPFLCTSQKKFHIPPESLSSIPQWVQHNSPIPLEYHLNLPILVSLVFTSNELQSSDWVSSRLYMVTWALCSLVLPLLTPVT